MEKEFQGSFTQQEPLSEEAIEAAIKVMRHGRLHRYNVLENETSEIDNTLNSEAMNDFST